MRVVRSLNSGDAQTRIVACFAGLAAAAAAAGRLQDAAGHAAEARRLDVPWRISDNDLRRPYSAVCRTPSRDWGVEFCGMQDAGSWEAEVGRSMVR